MTLKRCMTYRNARFGGNLKRGLLELSHCHAERDRCPRLDVGSVKVRSHHVHGNYVPIKANYNPSSQQPRDLTRQSLANEGAQGHAEDRSCLHGNEPLLFLCSLSVATLCELSSEEVQS